MWPYGKKAKLYRSVEKLVLYNDKGQYWSGHSESQVDEHRQELLLRINEAVEKVGRNSLPQNFLDSLENGTLKADDTGEILVALKQHFRS